MYPDPSVCRVGCDVYLVTSSFEYFPGVPIFHSRDLVDWRQLGHVLTRKSQLDLSVTRSSGGIYAPTLRHNEGTFYVVTTHVDRGNFAVTASRPEGPWSEPVWLDEEGIDPSLAFLDGRIYYTRNGPGRDADHPFVYQTELDRGLRPVRRPRVIWRGTGGIWPEAPHLYRRGAHYYLLTAEGGTSYGHSVVVARSRTPYGPFEPSPHGPLLTHRGRPRHPIQATGHADLVELGDGSTWVVLLGIRPSRGRYHHLGRETFLAPVDWRADGWPRFGRLELRMIGPASPPATAVRDDFGGRRLVPSWVFVRNPRSRDTSLSRRPGHLRLWGSPLTLRDAGSPALVCRRQQHLELVVRTCLDFEPQAQNEEAGMCIRSDEQFHVTLLVGRSARGREVHLTRTDGGRVRRIARADLEPGLVTLQIEASTQRYVFSAGNGARLLPLGTVSTRSLAAETITARTGRHHFTGAMLGLYATGNGRRSTAPADFDWFEYIPADASG
jgi:xylan 1,4-beta-xylosidase